MITGEHVRSCAERCGTFLSGDVDSDWNQRPPDIDMTVGELVAHVAQASMWYAFDLAAGVPDLEALVPQVNADHSNHELLRSLAVSTHILALVVDAAPPEARGFHPFGTADPSGFAAMSCDEMLIHTHDAARALGRSFDPPMEIVDAVLQRLFPGIAPSADPWPQLQWANGRIDLDGRQRLSKWKWHCAPLDEWQPDDDPSHSS